VACFAPATQVRERSELRFGAPQTSIRPDEHIFGETAITKQSDGPLSIPPNGSPGSLFASAPEMSAIAVMATTTNNRRM